MKRGLFIGRFQPFHYGHLDMVEYALKEVDELIIVIGSAQDSHTQCNPFTAGERYMMIKETLKSNNISAYIIPVPDNPSNAAWVATIESYVPKFDVVYTNEPLSRRLFKEAGYEVKGHVMRDRAFYCGTSIRTWMVHDFHKDSMLKWETYVSKNVEKFIKENNLIDRVVDLSKSDKV